MNHDLRRCPTCGAYVMSGDNICPRCDSPLDGLPPAATDLPAPDTISGGDETILDYILPDRSQLPTTRLPEVAAPADPESLAEPSAVPAETPEQPDEPSPDDRTDLAPVEALSAPASPEASQETASRAPTGEEAPDAAGTVTHLEAGIALAAAEEIGESELPTAEYSPGEEEIRPAPRRAEFDRPKYLVPPAPYTPPPVREHVPDPSWITLPPAPVYVPPPVYAYPAAPPVDRLPQRVQIYQHGGYRLHNRNAHDAVLSHGKTLSVSGWLLAFISIIGFLWYFLLVTLSGFRADRVYITREPDGSLYEDGAGAAHVRLKRARVGRRWAIFGSLIFAACLLLAILLGIAGGMVASQERYQSALREAYPAVTLFEEQFSQAEANPDDVALVKDGAVAYAILAGIAGVGLWGGATLFVIGTVHAGAYRVSVPPLPGMG